MTPAADGRGAGTGADTGIAGEIRRLLADATGRPELLTVPAGTALFGQGIGLDSLTGTLLLQEIRRRYGVDVAAEDLNLDSLATLGSLAGFVAERAGRPG